MYTRTRIAVSAFVVCIVLTLLPLKALAQDSDCIGVDLVFLMDESDSMKNNDRGDLRVDAIRVAIDLLGANVLYDCPEYIHRISVIGFGDESDDGIDNEQYVDSALINPSRNNFGNWRTQRETVKAQIPKPTANRGATDYRSAFEAASSQLEAWKAAPPDDKPRLRGAVVLADGGPCVVDLGCSTAGNSMNTKAYLDQLEDYLDPNGNLFPWRGDRNSDSVRIWLIAFNDTQVGPAYSSLNPAAVSGAPHGGGVDVAHAASCSLGGRRASTARLGWITNSSKLGCVCEMLTTGPE